MPPMSFFQGASNVKITGGEFNEVRGNYIVYDQSRHHSNVNSYNTTNRTIQNSGNNNSTVYHGAPQNARNPNYANQGADRAPSGSQGDQASFPNGHPVFPPPPIHPPMMSPQYLPPGSRVQNVDSFNVNNENVINVNNDNSTEYGIPTPRKRRKDRQRSDMDREADDEEEEATRPRRSGAARNPHSPYGHSQRPTYGPGAFPTTSSAQFSPGHMRGMSPDVQKTFETLMQHVQEQTAPAGEEEDSSDEEVQDPRMTDPASLNAGMSHMSLDENRPPYSRVKSDPQNPYHHPAPASAHTASPDPVRPESVPYLPEHMQHPFFMPPGPATPTSGPYTAYAPPPIPPWNGQHPPGASASAEPQSPPHTGTPHAAPHTQGGANDPYGDAPMAPPPPRPSGPTFNTIHGDYNKVDQSVHSTNIGSGNTYNTLIQDSYNDNSVRSYAQPTPKPRGQGRRR